MRVTVLGAATVRRSGAPVDLGGPKVRSLLAAFALHAGRAISPERIVDLLWQQDAPPAVTASLQTYVARLRRALEPHRMARAPSTVLVTSSAGYSLILPDGALDATAFRRCVELAHRRVASPTGGLPRTSPDLAIEDLLDLRTTLTATLDLWTDTPYLDLPDNDAVLAERAGLQALRLIAVEDLALVRIALGEESAVAADLEAMTAAHPLRETLWATRILALARAGQQHESLATARAVRTCLADELGVDPGPMLQELEHAVLRQSAELWWRPPGSRTAVRTSAAMASTPRELTERSNQVFPPIALGSAMEWPLIGRKSQLEALSALLDGAVLQGCAFAMVIGEPGIGKSRLLRELADRATSRDFLVLCGSCSQDEGAPALWPFARILADLDDERPPDSNDRVDLRPGSATDPERFARDPDDRGRWDLWEAVLRRLRRAATTSPLLIVIDDLHWADPSSLALLRHLVGRLSETGSGGPIVIVMARRRLPEPSGPLATLGEILARSAALRMELGGLGPTDIETLVRTATGSDVRSARTQELWERTGGNPFFLTELIRLTRQRPARTTNQERSDREIPPAVADVVLSRVSGLPGRTRQIVGVASVIGRDFDVVLLAAIETVDVDAALDLLEPAVRIGLILESRAGQFRFSHALVRDAVYGSLSATRRALRHAAIADAMDRGTEPDSTRPIRGGAALDAGRSPVRVQSTAGFGIGGGRSDDPAGLGGGRVPADRCTISGRPRRDGDRLGPLPPADAIGRRLPMGG